MPHFTPETRKRIYLVVTATVPLLITLGILTGEVAAHVLNIAAAILSVGASTLAFGNVAPTLPDEYLRLEEIARSYGRAFLYRSLGKVPAQTPYSCPDVTAYSKQRSSTGQVLHSFFAAFMAARLAT